MKAKVITMLLMATILAACSSGGSASPDDNPVEVRLSVEAPGSNTAKTITAYDNVDNLKYYYTAVPQWKNGASDAESGTVTTMREFTNGNSLGTFKPGYWLFSVEVRNTVADVTSVVYTGFTYTHINSGSTSVSVNVSPSAGTGAVDIIVYVPTASENESLAISYSGTFGASGISADASRITEPGIYQYYTSFTKTISDLPSGGYTFLLDYNDGETQGSLSGGLIGGAPVDVNVIAGATTTVIGTLEGGVFREVDPTVVTPGFAALTMTQGEDIPAGSMASPGATVVQADTDTSFSVTCIPKAGTVINSYEWYLNSVFQETGGTAYTLNVPSGKYVLTCVVTGIAWNRTVTASVKSIVVVQ